MAFTQGHALIIGVSEYIHHPEANIALAAEDARQVAAVLGDKRLCGYLPEHVSLLSDQQATRDAVIQALAGLAGVSQEDTVLLFYSGHGALGADGNYHLSACDSRFAEGKIKDCGISEGELLGLLHQIPARRMILLIQACFAGELTLRFGPEKLSVESAGLTDSTVDAILGSGEGRVLITSSRAGQSSWGRIDQQTSFFTRALVDGLRGEGWVSNNAGYIGAFGLYEYVYQTVKEAAQEIRQQQEPVLSAVELVGSFPLALYRGASELRAFNPAEALPVEYPVRRVAEKRCRQLFERRVIKAHTYNEVDVIGQQNIVEAGTITGGIQAPGGVVVINPPPPDPEEAARSRREKARRAYLEGLYGACQAMRFAPLGGDDSELIDFTLNDVYIELDTQTPVEPEGSRAGGLGLDVRGSSLTSRGGREAVFSALEVAARHKRLVLLGDPGSGKSTFARRLLSWLAASALDRLDGPPGFEPGLTPVLVTLRHLAARLNLPGYEELSAAGRDSRLLEALREQVAAELRQMDLKPDACEYAPELLEALQGGGCLMVLDGLDEVPFALRARVRQAVVAAIRRYRLARVIITCRVRSYRDDAVFKDFAAHTLAPLDAPKIIKFCQDWYQTQAKYLKISADRAVEQSAGLVSAASDPELQEMPTNPMLLTCLAILHQANTRLPRERVKLFARVVDLLVLRWQQEKAGRQVASSELLRWLNDSQRLRQALDRLGYEAHLAGDDLPRWKAQQTLESRELMGSPQLAVEFLDYADQSAGILVGYGGEEGGPAASYGFPHRLLQEYLAGCYVFSGRDLAGNVIQHAGQGDGWDLAVQLGMEELCFNEPRQGPNTLLSLAYHLSAVCAPRTLPEQRALLWTGQVAALLGAPVICQDTRFPNGGSAFVERIGRQLVQVMGGELPPVERSEAGNALARLGDPRPAVMTVAGMEFCCVPGGPFRMGSGEEDQRADGDEKPAHEVTLPACWMGRYPVTRAQFGEFVSEHGYEQERFWPEARAAGYWKPEGWFQGRFDREARRGPFDYGRSFSLPNHPVVGVSWYEALAFARWLEEKALAEGWLGRGWRVALPSEAEWEKAARGGKRLPKERCIRALSGLAKAETARLERENPDSDRIYPWEGAFDARRANTAEGGIGATSAVGCFPQGASEYGVEDLSGNVWEWTRSLFAQYPYAAGDGREDLAERGTRVLRGGSWHNARNFARCACRNGGVPDYFDYLLNGFRIVCSPSSSLGSGALEL